MKRSLAFGVVVVLAMAGCDKQPPDSVTGGASVATAKANDRVAREIAALPQADIARAERGLIAGAPLDAVTNAKGEAVWEPAAYNFVEGEAPATVNPSLWRQARLNNIRGLFKVSEGIYQLRGFDLANMTLVEGDTGWVVIDPLTTVETSSNALAFARKHLGDKPVRAVVFSHSHIDHFGGVLGVVSPEQVAAEGIAIVAPRGFIEEATSENIIAGPAMTRRAMYMYGQNLPRSATGHVDSGLGKQPVFGSTSILQPTRVIMAQEESVVLDGVEFVFRNVPGSEAPAEMTIYLPAMQAFCGAELISHTLHNLYTLRGAKVRDALAWSGYIDEAMTQAGPVEVFFGTHNWPVWGTQAINEFMRSQRDLYKFIHDQTLRHANAGLTPREIAEVIKLPASLEQHFGNRDYYGTVSHNSKAVYQYYFGWYDANPANLNPLPPTQSAVRYVAAMGGADNMLNQAQQAYDEGDYRWVAELLNHLVFAQPDNRGAKALLAQSYQQMAYQAESGPWRDVYLSGAFELLNGAPKRGVNLEDAALFLAEVPLLEFMKAISVRLNAEKAEGEALVVNFIFTDLQQSYVLEVRNSVMHYRIGEPAPEANASLSLSHPLFLALLTGRATIAEALLSDELALEGSRLDLLRFFSLLDKPTGAFAIVSP